MGRKYLAWASKYLALWVALVIVAVIAIRPMYWLGSIGFGWVIFWLAVAAAVLFTYLRSYLRWYETKSFVKSIPVALLWGILIVGTILAGILLWSSAPELSAGDVKTIINASNAASGLTSLSQIRAVSAEYEGGGIWRVRLLGPRGVSYLHYDEKSRKRSDLR